ncbi:MAG: tetratricopeptide repeat protein [Crocinitomicaceae bacterium]|nr:tetratricopeptide repeat protein [Crocinitomicaceae bacterium]
MKNYSLIAISMLVAGALNAQTIEDAKKKTENERYELAAKDFRTLIQASPSNGEIYFFQGDNYLQSKDLDSAKIAWAKGYSVDPTNFYSIIGVGKSLWYSGDTTAANVKFEEAIGTAKKKNPEVLRQVASPLIYAPIKSLNRAVTLLNLAIKYDNKNVQSYLLLGDANLEINSTNATEAMKSYNTALELSKTANIIVRKAKVYQRAQNYELANEMYKEAQALEPNYAPAYRENAELNMQFNQYNSAILNWEKYLQLNNSEQARYRYATSLFSGKKYCEAITEFESLHNIQFENLYTQRLLAYSLYECYAAKPDADTTFFEKGMEASNRFFAITKKKDIIGLDYKYKGLLLNKLGKDSLGMIELKRAAIEDTTISKEIWSEIAKIQMTNKEYDQAIEAFNMNLQKDSSNLTVAEYYELGRAYFFGPKDYAMADLAFTKVAELTPNYSFAYFWRARSNVQLDLKKETWAAKEHYEKFIETLSVEDREGAYKPYVIEGAKYMGDFYVNSPDKNKEKAKEAWNLVRQLDPADKQAKAFFASPAGK